MCTREIHPYLRARDDHILPNKVSIFMVQILDDEARSAQPLWRNAILHELVFFCSSSSEKTPETRWKIITLIEFKKKNLNNKINSGCKLW